MTASSAATPSAGASPTPPEDRRSFFSKCLAVLVGGIASLVPLAAGLAVLFDPLARRRSGGAKSVRITTLDSLPADGTPRSFPVISERTDVWTQYPPEPIGGIYLRRQEDDQVTAFNAVCPHAGCFVEFSSGKFRCPCHNSDFEADGSRINPGSCPSPRDLDPLPVDLEKLQATGEVWIEFKNFASGTEERIPQA